jgi:hypothetical protein
MNFLADKKASYKIFVEGTGFFTKSQYGKQPVGFFTTVYLREVSARNIRQNVVLEVQKALLRNHIFSKNSSCSKCKILTWEEIEDIEETKCSGFTLFPETVTHVARLFLESIWSSVRGHVDFFPVKKIDVPDA